MTSFGYDKVNAMTNKGYYPVEPDTQYFRGPATYNYDVRAYFLHFFPESFNLGSMAISSKYFKFYTLEKKGNKELNDIARRVRSTYKRQSDDFPEERKIYKIRTDKKSVEDIEIERMGLNTNRKFQRSWTLAALESYSASMDLCLYLYKQEIKNLQLTHHSMQIYPPEFPMRDSYNLNDQYTLLEALSIMLTLNCTEPEAPSAFKTNTYMVAI
jgi:hypothetical protein